MKLSGEVVVVTGAGRGIGRAIALMQASEGAKIALDRADGGRRSTRSPKRSRRKAGSRAPIHSISSTSAQWRGHSRPSSATSAQ